VAVEIRSVRPDEFGDILSFWRTATEVASSTDDMDGLTALHRFDPEALIVAAENKTILGTLIVAFDGWRGSFYRLAVQPEDRGRGIGRALVREGESRLIGRGCRRVSLYAVLAHEAAISFWKAVGYTQDGADTRFVTDLRASDLA
jgi:ribosomal protein S18 acetylase RimI-like enzyme